MYSHSQRFAYTCNEHVYDDSPEFHNLYNSYSSVMNEWNTKYFYEVWFSNELIIGLLTQQFER